MNKTIILGKRGSFHEEAALQYFGDDIEIIPSKSFNELGDRLSSDPLINNGVLAIENTIAGTLLQNYRLLREKQFTIVGEKYLKIKHNLMGIADIDIKGIKTIISHPMAIYQCQSYFSEFKNIEFKNSADTVTAVKEVFDRNENNYCAIGSRLAGRIYGLKILIEDITKSDNNFTRFFIIQKNQELKISDDANKSSIYLRTSHQKGSLLKVLEQINEEDINISKLQSYPVPGEINKYLFHLDLEFDHVDQHYRAIKKIGDVTEDLKVLGIYKRDL